MRHLFDMASTFTDQSEADANFRVVAVLFTFLHDMPDGIMCSAHSLQSIFIVLLLTSLSKFCREKDGFDCSQKVKLHVIYCNKHQRLHKDYVKRMQLLPSNPATTL